jgi:hypothetical protein
MTTGKRDNILGSFYDIYCCSDVEVTTVANVVFTGCVQLLFQYDLSC